MRLVLLIILVALPGIAALSYQSLLDRETAINAALERATNIIEITNSEQANLIEETRVFLQRLSTFESVLNSASPECSVFLANILKLNGRYVNLGIPRADGQLLCNAIPLDNPVNVADRPYIKQAIATRDFSIGKFQTDRAAGVTSINFAYPVINPITNVIGGLAVAVVSLDWWSNRLSQARLPEHTVAYITDHEQNIIAAYPTDSKLLGANIRNVQGALFESNTTLDLTSKPFMSADNHLRMFVSKALFTTGDLANINISVGIPLDDDLSAINSHFIKTGIFIIIFVFLMFVVAIKGIQKSVLNPLKALLQSTIDLELGKNVGDSLQPGSPELVSLHKNFTSMAKTRLNTERQLRNSQISLQESESKLSRHIENTPLGCISWDIDFICTEWNKSAENIFGYRADEAVGRKATKLIVTADLSDEIYTLYQLLLEQKGGEYTTLENVTKKGDSITCEWHNTPLVDANGSVTGVTSLIQDITNRKKSEEKLKLAASVFSHAREGIVITDASGSIIDVNDTFTDITGYSREEVLGQDPSILQSPGRQSPAFYANMWQTIKTSDYWEGEVWNRRKNGETYIAALTISTVNDGAGKVSHYVRHFSDITRQKEHQDQLEQMANFDALTKLPNRTLLADRLNQAILESQRHHNSIAVVFLDLDDFKVVNDIHGHDIGDELLIALSQRMKEALRDGDTLARIGGDEFVAVLPNLAKAEDCQLVLDRLLFAASEPVSIRELVLTVSGSIGVTVYPKDGADSDILIRHADQAMYVAKKEGKNRYHLFDTAHDDAANIQRVGLSNIRRALDRGEFVLYYQPKVNMPTGDVVGVEALIRWQHPVLGLVPPLDFLPIIEGHALSLAVGEWVIDTALSQISHWQSEGLTLPVSVNISAYQLQQTDFVARLEVLLAGHRDVSPGRLELEVLESGALTDINSVSMTMHACKDLGVDFALDDFGTGYSSLTHLRRLPACLIKIDQSFVRDMLEDPDDLAIVKGVISLAKSFKRHVIAEGVETIEHGTALLELGCELAQGYGIARPMPASDIAEWAAEWEPDDAWLTI